MAYFRGFKTEANDVATQIRRELKLGPFDPLDPRVLAEHLEVPVVDLSSLLESTPSVKHLLVVEPEAFSAVTVFRGSERTIVHNDGHVLPRQSSNICHELGHALLLHPPTPPMDDKGCRIWNQDLEDEANWLGGILLVTEAATIAIAKGKWTVTSAAWHFGVSPAMIRFRMNATAARMRVARSQQFRRKPSS